MTSSIDLRIGQASAAQRLRAEQILKKARSLIAPEGAWTQNTAARDALGRHVTARDDSAVCWCSAGAIRCAREVLGMTQNDEELARDLLQSVIITANNGVYRSIVDYNDSPGRQQRTVLEKFDRAAALAVAS